MSTTAHMSSTVLPDEVVATAKEHAQWLLHRLVPGRGVCNLATGVRVDREIRWWPLQEALNHLLRRHPALRVAFRSDGVTLRKWFRPEGEEFPLTVETATEETVDALLTDLMNRPFDLDSGVLVRAHLIVVDRPDIRTSVLCFVVHHLAGDFVTATVLHRETAKLYDSFAETGGPPPELAATAPIHLEPPADAGSVDYWVEHLAGADPATMAMAGARPIVGRPTFAGSQFSRRMSEEAHAAALHIQGRVRLSQNIVLLTAYYLLLARYGAGPDLVVGVPVSGRGAAPPEVVGFHTATMPVRVRVDDDATVAALVQRVASAFLTGLEHAAVSFEEVQNRLPVRSSDWRVPLFRHMFNYRMNPFDERGKVAGQPALFGGEPMHLVEVPTANSRLDLELCVFPGRTAVRLAAVYSTEVHDAAFVETFVDRYEATLIEMAERLDDPVGTVSGWSPADHDAQRRLDDTSRDFPGHALLADVRRWAVDRPAAPAMSYEGRTVSYRELVAAAEAVRRRLVDEGVRAGETVALHASRGPELAAAALGVWAAGAAYLPLDPQHPAARLADQLGDAGATLILADDAPDPACLTGRRWLPLAELCGAAVDGPVPDWPSPDPASVAYVIYTSGSTGRPKGVEVSHASLANLVRDFAERLAVVPEDRTLWLTTMSFDISGLELFLPLTTGGTSVVSPDADRVDPDRLLDLIVDRGVTVAQATPTTWRHVAGELRGRLRGRRVLCGGEPLSAALAERLLADGCRLFNVYGPTETTIWSTAVELTSPVPTPVPLGGPIANTTIRVLDPDGRPVLPGVPGEVCIGGAGVALGYRGRPDLTAQRFRESPDGGRYYRTGDLARQTGSGLEFLGRLDRQVKVRGHRVELTEIEEVLESHPEVRAAAVVTEPDIAGHLRLVAVVLPEPGDPPGERWTEQLRQHVAARLPSGAVPSRYVIHSELPLTGNGKVDHGAVTAWVGRQRQSAELPDDPRLRSLVRLWREILEDEQLGRDADFFLNGGHSLLAVTLAERVSVALGTHVGFEAIFDAPTPDRLLALLDADAGDGGAA